MPSEKEKLPPLNDDDPTTDADKNIVLRNALDEAAQNDPTRFTTRSFVVLWNEGHSMRLINRDNPRKAISIPWDELDALPDYPTEEQAEQVLRAAGTSGKEVANVFIERLLRENLELKTKLAATTQSSDQVAREIAIRATQEIKELIGNANDQSPSAYIVRPFEKTVAIIIKHLRAAAVPVEPQVEVNQT